MSQGCRKHSPAFKAKVSLEALKDQETVAQLAARYDIHPGRFKPGRRLLRARQNRPGWRRSRPCSGV